MSPPGEKTAHVSSMLCLTASSSIQYFFIVHLCSALLLPLSFLFFCLAQFAFQHLAGRSHGQCLAELNDAWVLVVGHVLF